MHIILSAPFRTHINDRLKPSVLRMSEIPFFFLFSMLPLLIYKVINGMTPSYLNQLFNYVNNIHSVCVRPGIQSEDQNNFFTFKVRTFWQSEVKISVLALWLGALSSLFHNIGCRGYGRYPLFVRARHVQRCVKQCPHFECVIHRFVLALNAGTNTLYTRVYSVSSLWMPEQVGGTRKSKAGDLYTPKCNTNYGRNTFQYKGCVLWNVISRNIRNANTFKSFKMNFKKDLKL